MLPILLLLAAPQNIPDWLAGLWCTENSLETTCEDWSRPVGTSMRGQGYVEKGGQRRLTEEMRIEAGTQGLAFYGMPEGQPEVRFAAVETSATRLAFAAPTHDYPKRIEYRLEGDTLVATISGANPAADSKTWRYRRLR